MKTFGVLVAFMMIIATSKAHRKCKGKLKAAEQELEEAQEQLKAVQQELAELKQTKACRFHFEHGIQGWEETGTAFDNQPTFGDNPTARGRGQPARQEGNWWIGGYEDRPSEESKAGAVQGDGPQGTLTSPSFQVTGRYISFLIGGGCEINKVRAELIIDGQVVKRATGKCHETMTREFWDVSDYVGKEAQLKLIDKSSSGWGHINFDDLRGDISCAPDQ